MTSPASCFLNLPLVERQKRLSRLSPEELSALPYEWKFWARPEQLTPGGDWDVWLIKAGRGFGKTRTGAEQVRIWAKEQSLVNLIGATADDARDIMVEGESGILACCPDKERPQYRKSERKLIWPNGSISLIFTADEPERLRGKQHAALWCDELAAWRYPDSWDQAMLGLRLGNKPQAVVTTTPRPTKLVKQLIASSRTVVTHGSTYDNRQNLAPSFLNTIITRYEGTRMGRQELLAEVLDDNPNALWQRSKIDELRVSTAPPLKRIVLGVDPAVTSKEDSDLTGLVVAGQGTDNHWYILGDYSLIATPDGWAREAVRQYHNHKCDRLIAEVNNGGELVETVIRTVDRNIAYKAVHASRGKMIRAEPIAALYEQGRVHHVGSFPQLEDEMCDFDPLNSDKSPDRMDAMVWAMTELSAIGTTGLIDYYAALAG